MEKDRLPLLYLERGGLTYILCPNGWNELIYVFLGVNRMNGGWVRGGS